MTTQTYAVLDPHAVGPSEEIQRGGIIATCNADAQDIHRLIRGDTGFSSGTHYVEFTFYGEGDLAGLVSCGIVTALHPLNLYVGESVEGFGYKAGDGDIWNDDTSVATVDATEKKITIGVLLEADDDQVTFFVNNNEAAVVAITPGQTWYFAAGLGSTVAYDLFCFVQTGANEFRFPQPGNPGWFSTFGASGLVRIASDIGYLTAPTDTPANTLFSPGLLDGQNITVARTGSVWTMTNRSDGSSYASVPIANEKGQFDYLLEVDCRNAKFELRMQPVGEDFTESFVAATALVNTIKTDGEAKLRAELAGTMASIQRPLQTKIFPPYVDEGAAFRPEPIVAGAVRNWPPVLIDEEERLFQVGDQPMSVGILRGGGDPFDPNATPPDYVQTSDLKSIVMQVMPISKLVGDFSNLGVTNIIPGDDDILDDAGLFTIWTNPADPPDGWSETGVGTLTRRGLAQNFPQDFVAEVVTSEPWSPTNGKFGYSIDFPSILEGGGLYTLTFKVRAVTGTPPSVFGGLQFGLRVMTALDNAPSSYISGFNQPIQTPLWRNDDQYTLQFAVPAGGPRNLYFNVSAAAGPTGGTASGACILSFYGIRLEKLPTQAPQVPLQGMTYSALVQNICQRLGLDPTTDYVLQDAIDIDEALGYKSFGFATQDPINGDEVLRQIGDTVCGCTSEDHLGRIRFGYLFDPELVDDGDVALDCTQLTVAYPVNAEFDEGKGLTTTAGYQKDYYIHTDSDFVSDLSPITGIDAATRTRFKKESQYLVTSTAPLSSFYQHARSAAPIIFNLDDGVEAQAEIDRVNRLYATPPLFYTFTVWLTPSTVQAAAQLVLFKSVVRVSYKNPPDREINGVSIPGTVRYGLENKKALVVDMTLGPRGLYVTLTVWIPNVGL
jgi:hypothetical protein